MENASKALIIAGAILLAIVIIGLGMMVFRQASGVIDPDAMEELSVSSFNQKFTQYEGKNVRGSNVNSLLSAVIQNNVGKNSDDKSRQIKVTVTAQNGTTWDGTIPSNKAILSTSDSGKALTGKTYIVTTGINDKTGYIEKITIKAN